VATPAVVPVQRRAPTPADPFAGQMDEILMAMEAAEQQAAARATRPRRTVEAAPVSEAPAASVAAPEPAAEPLAEPATEQAAEPVATVAAPAAEAPVAAVPVAPASVPAPEREEPVIGQPVTPVVLGADAPDALPRKRGWWRR
jgi:ribonuclease E